MTKGLDLIASRYARALLTQDLQDADPSKQDHYQKVFDALTNLFAIREASDVIKNPSMSVELKMDLLRLALDASGADEKFRKFIMNVLEAKREGLIPQMAKAYIAQLAELRNEKHVVVCSARQMPDDLMAKIEEKLRAIFGKKILIKSEINKNLLGGFVVEVGNFLFDCSLRSMVDRVMK